MEDVTPLELVQEALGIIENRALDRSNIDWEVQKPQWLKEAATLHNLAEAHEFIKNVLTHLKDNHSHIIPAAETFADASFDPDNPVPSGFLFSERMGVINIPWHGGDGKLGDGRNYALVVQDVLYDLEQQGASAWVIDLRKNGGGNMWPMLAGLAPLLSKEVLGAFVDPSSNSRNPWRYDGEKLWISDSVVHEAKVQPLKNLFAPLALLTSGKTLSSGEAVLISFLGRPNTRTFGEPTGGLPTANESFQLRDKTWLLLTTTLEADRLGRLYKSSISPDVFVKINWEKLNQSDDPVLITASKWVEEVL